MENSKQVRVYYARNKCSRDREKQDIFIDERKTTIGELVTLATVFFYFAHERQSTPMFT